MRDLIITQIDELHWEGKIRNKLICEFNYFSDYEGKYWINGIFTYDSIVDNKGKGHGRSMIIKALQVYHEIYVNKADKSEIKKLNHKNDYRYFNEYCFEESDLFKFTSRLIEDNILKKEWIKSPEK